MNKFLMFAFESGISIAILYCLYWVLLRRETYFRVNRVYLLGSIVVAAVLPLLHFKLIDPGVNSTTALIKFTGAFQIQEIAVESDAAPEHINSAAWILVLAILYFLISLGLFSRLILGIVRIHILKRRGMPANYKGFKVIYIQSELPPFSFFRTIFLNESLMNDLDKEMIIAHEIAHAKQLHSLDSLFVELALVLNWFNPIMWQLRSSLRTTHEYLADEEVLRNEQTETTYLKILLSQAQGLKSLVLANGFNSNIKKRIIMMHSSKSSKMAKLKPMMFLPVLLALTFLFACEERNANTYEDNPKIVNNEGITAEMNDIAETLGTEGQYFDVDEMPKFNGSNPEVSFQTYLDENLVYPEIAKENGIKGEVVIQFGVNEDGKVVDATIVKSADPSLAKEALRVVLSSPEWTPGIQNGMNVNVLYKFSINFTLD
jgi:TonB family protein